MDKVIRYICGEYDIDYDELNQKLDDNNILKKKKNIKFLPWNGNVKTDCCQGIKYADGLFIQCTKNIHENNYCKMK